MVLPQRRGTLLPRGRDGSRGTENPVADGCHGENGYYGAGQGVATESTLSLDGWGGSVKISLSVLPKSLVDRA